MTLVVTDAIVLHVQDYLESSRIVRMATREHGVQSVLARGARKPRSRYGSSLDLFVSGVAHFTLKPGRDLSNLTGFDLTRSRMGLAADLDRCCSCGIEVPTDRPAPFSHHGGGVVCEKCRRTVSVGRELPADARAAVAAWLAHEEGPSLSDLAQRSHLRLLREFLHHHMSDG